MMAGGLVGACDVHSPLDPGSVFTLTVSPNPTLEILATQQFVAVALDADGVEVPITPTWSVEAGGGTINSAGLFTAGTVPGVYPATIQAVSGGQTATATVTVIVGPLATLTVSPDPETLAVNEAQVFTAIGRDEGGNVVPITPTWSVVGGGGSIGATTGNFTAGTVAGDFPVTVRATSGNISGSASVTVTAGSLASIVVSPDPEAMQVTDTQLFTAVGFDAFGNVVAISPEWTVENGGGTIDTDGTFTAGNAPGTFDNTVRATSGAIFGDATVTVGAGSLATITVTPDPETLGVNETQLFTAVGRDAQGNVVPITPTWSVVNGGGSINSGGTFRAGSVAGTFASTVRARSDGIDGFATVVVAGTAPAPLINLGAAATHGILAGSTITCVALGTVEADASVFPGSAFTGFPPCTITGEQHAADAFAQTAQNDLTSAYNQLDGLPCDATITADLGGTTLQPGVYCSTSSVGLTGEMFFDALGDPNASLVIKAASTLTTASAQVTLLNGAQARNIYWLVGSSATIGIGSAMKGNIITFQSVTLNNNATLLGRALARNGAVTLGSGNTITLP